MAASEFVGYARRYSELGWAPVPLSGKVPLERGLTGRKGIDCWDLGTYELWTQLHRGCNIGVRAPKGVVGIDVDMYKKKQGKATLAAAEAEWGSLPATWRSTSRHDGSAIRWFRVPADVVSEFEAISVLPQGRGVELIDHGYRYAVVAPSIHPDTGDKYRWLDADGIEVEFPPRPEDLPELPRRWVDGLSKQGAQRLTKATEAEGNAFLDALPDGEMSPEVAMAVVGMLKDFQIEGSRNPSMNSGVFKLLKNSAHGDYVGVPTALKLLRTAYIDALAGDRSEQVAAHEFDKAVTDGSQAAAAVAGLCRSHGAFEPGGLWHEDTPYPGQNRKQLRKLGLIDAAGNKTDAGKTEGAPTDIDGDRQSDDARFPMFSAAELASRPRVRLEWLIRGVWVKGSFGPVGGPSKSLKSYNVLAMAVAVASGEPLFDHFPVEHTGPVIIFTGEGGNETARERLELICEKQGLTFGELPIYLMDESATLSDPAFRGQLHRRIERIAPALVVIDPLYAYHSENVEAQNLYSRGRMLRGLSALVKSRCALMVVDHFNKSAEGMDLNDFGQSGMAAWADSWVTMQHRSEESREGIGDHFELKIKFGSRRTAGGRLWMLDWWIPFAEDELGVQVPDPDGKLDWSIKQSTGSASGKGAGKQTTDNRRCDAVIAHVREHEWQKTKTQVVQDVGGNASAVRKVIDNLLSAGVLVSEVRDHPEGDRVMSRELLGLGEGRGELKIKLRSVDGTKS